MSSWATMLAASGFKPDVPNRALAIVPAAPGDFHAPWVTASGFGTIRRAGGTLSIHCASGKIDLKRLQLGMAAASARVGERALAAHSTKSGQGVMLEFSSLLSLAAGQTLSVS